MTKIWTLVYNVSGSVIQQCKMSD